ncbi:Putative disease resistance protein RGA4 [Morus notabilis]|uniref:Putative disease resistance protein RGA4 n=1 Tax=Morus notabilis TaxID=981085 RepID=W9R5R6_9ROSA|nr:putative disease resistance protein RGA3 [Morus notabilis]EXB55144.1 Putative disease resistance protein RGA4 [Morus notabilis]
MERTTEERTELENIGRQIARKSSGLPLVAKTLGSLMRFRKTISQWEDILCSELWESKDVKVREIFAPFLLSYYDLSPLQKRCFLYCSVYPKDSNIGRDDLIEMWMSQGYLSQTINSKKEGRDCFESLAMRSFFQDFEEDEYYGAITCKMHDIVHDFAQFLMGSEYVLIEVDGIEENKKEVDESTRHLTIVVGSEDHFLTLRHNAKNLRTIYIYANTNKLHVDRILLFSHLTRVRTLKLCGYIESLLEDIGLLKHLRYLDLSVNTNLKELPGTLFNLYNLQTLKLCYCFSLPRLPEKIAKLVNLKNLYIKGCRFEGLPKGIAKLTGLLTLDMWVVPKERKTYFDLGDLKMLKYLQFQSFLCIQRCANAGNLDESEKINLSNWQHLLDLTLRFRETDELYEIGEILDDDTEILESLQPHPNLKALEISVYLGATVSPTWMMSLTNLTSLVLISYTKCEILPPLGKMPSLVSLVICCLVSLKKVGPEFLGIIERDEEDHGTARRDQDSPSEPCIISFPRLKKLKFDMNVEWKEGEGYRMTTKTPTKIMPCLHSLKITKCHNLESLPDFLQMTPLQNLSVKKSRILQRNVRKGTGKEWYKISHVPNIQINKKYVQKNGV